MYIFILTHRYHVNEDYTLSQNVGKEINYLRNFVDSLPSSGVVLDGCTHIRQNLRLGGNSHTCFQFPNLKRSTLKSYFVYGCKYLVYKTYALECMVLICLSSYIKGVVAGTAVQLWKILSKGLMRHLEWFLTRVLAQNLQLVDGKRLQKTSRK